MVNNEFAKQICEILCGKSLIADLFKDGLYYFEIPDFVFRVSFDDENFVTILKVYPPDAKTIWQLTMPNEIDKIKSIVKILES